MMASRILDLAIAVLILPFVAVLSIFLSVAIAFCDGPPLFFSQERIGLFDRRFRLYKFRSMLNAVDSHGQFLPDSSRLTPAGRWLRASSLDELPQLWNVLRGDMAIVGPRPLPVAYLPRYSVRQRRRHLVRPGITGWAQVNGRNALTWEQKFDLDVWYVDHRNIRLDLKILWLTVLKVIRREGISQDGHATMPEFLGEP
jgi:sugar transferase EpsL